jgi:hypothetical protein
MLRSASPSFRGSEALRVTTKYEEQSFGSFLDLENGHEVARRVVGREILKVGTYLVSLVTAEAVAQN